MVRAVDFKEETGGLTLETQKESLEAQSANRRSPVWELSECERRVVDPPINRILWLKSALNRVRE